jgi:hypothetical protein
MGIDDIVGRKKKKLIELPKVEVEAEVIVADASVEKHDLH